MDAALPWGGHEEPAELPKLAANDRGARGRVDPGGLDQGGGWIGALSTSNAIIAYGITWVPPDRGGTLSEPERGSATSLSLSRACSPDCAWDMRCQPS